MNVLADPFLVRALMVGLPVGFACGLAGYLLALRGELFTGDALGHVAFTGGLGALALGLSPALGVFAGTVGAGAGLGLLGSNGARGVDDVVTGTVFAWILGVGVLALSVVSSGSGAARGGAAGVRALFGSIFGLSGRQAVVAALVAVSAGVLMVVISRPLLFAGLDPSVARARGVRVRALDVVFLVAVGAAAGAAAQAVGALLFLGLLSAPAGAARRLSARPSTALLLAGAIGAGSTALGLVLSAGAPTLPPSFAIMAVAAGGYVVAVLLSRRHAWPQ